MTDAAEADLFGPGFAEPGLAAQRTFRALLDAMARPGRVHRVDGVAPPPPLGIATAAVLLTLADHATAVALPDDASVAWPWLAFHTGAERAVSIGAAAFVVAGALPPLDVIATGTDDAPEEGATVILPVSDLGRGLPLRLRGPGIEATQTLAVDGLPPGALAWFAANRALAPRGVDVILTAGDRLACLPRTTTVDAAMGEAG